MIVMIHLLLLMASQGEAEGVSEGENSGDDISGEVGEVNDDGGKDADEISGNEFEDVLNNNNDFRESPLKEEGKSSDISDGKNIIDDMMEDIKENEGFKNHAYLDTKGNITLGAGKNIDGTSDPHNNFMNQPWLNSEGKEASDEQKQEYWDYLQGEKEKSPKDENGKITNNNIASSYKDKENGLHLSEEYIEQQAKEHMEQNILTLKDKLEKEGIDFDKLPANVQEGLIDMEYNMGPNFNKDAWDDFFGALKIGDNQSMADESHGKDIGKDRNQWRYDKFLGR